ncbi:unnamed protein product [Pelagomonas calceolata]|uniref:Protein-tyrosine sulfotransferase n=1 Tax=Pelagomonas calceolata TaxID=35677 RepID=A0A7S4E701_9STRA|nr:unnamed protein product [Pelagomonas calceolata]|mmetsp:Transcript_22835/g.68265  ORF Transcript_22835/g.68265 Transcript_22835/m.68265 type:complete len:278 (-) Transcript_22835:4-837(-)
MLSLFAALLLLGSSGAVQLFVVVSAPRSGTEWLRLMLAGHPRVCCDGEVLLRLGRRAQRPGGLDIRRALDAFARGAAPEYDDVLRPCRKPGARARGFKWFDGQGGASVASENAALGNLSAWRAAHAAKLIVLERQGLAKLVSDRLKHLSSQRGVDAVPTHCRDASCAARVSAQRVTLDAGALETQLDAGVRRFSALLNWARAAAAFDDILYIAYGDLVADPERELRRAYRFLGVDEAWQANASVLTKSVSRPLAEVVANYGEVRAALLRTKWAGEVG